MIAIVDSGSTKADWKFLNTEGQVQDENTPGFNPFIHNTADIAKTLEHVFQDKIAFSNVTKIHYYGAGCSDEFRCSIVAAALSKVFPKASIFVEHDLLGAARATCMNQAGIACILGTGSNSCAYDGKRIIDNVTNLGHILGDEGSGYHLGKKIVQAYFYRECPEEIKTAFERSFPFENKRVIIDNIYGGSANVYLSSFATFVGQFKDHGFVRKLVKSAFNEFLTRHVFKYEGYKSLPISFNGSIAFHFSDILENLLCEHNLNLGVIIQKPIDKLLEYHLEKEKISYS